MTCKVEVYDTTLRDGAQGEGISFSLADKLRLTEEFDTLGIHYVEGGWPGSNPKDLEFFTAVRKLKLRHTRVVAFGSTRHAKNSPAGDPNLQCLVRSGVAVATIFGKSWDLHVRDALRVSLEQNLDMIYSSVEYLKKRIGRVIFDAEHFFDGYRANSEYALKALAAAAEAGAETVVLCDTNGGSLPSVVAEVVRVVRAALPQTPVGIHAHNDGGMAVANSVEAVAAGARQVQGTMNGLGERTGNADLVQVLPNLELKLGHRCLGEKQLRRLTESSRFVYETANLPAPGNQPFVGRSAFAHKAGVHVSAMARNPLTYEHIRPETVGNERRILVSELSGRSNILARSRVDLSGDPAKMQAVLAKLMELENQGYSFENAEGSFDLLVRRVAGDYVAPFKLLAFRVISEANGRRVSEASVKVDVGGIEYHTVSEGDHGPVNALDKALRKALLGPFPLLEELKLVDYKVHIVNAQAAAEAKVRVVVESEWRGHSWNTVGVSENIIDASVQALVDAYEYLLVNYGGKRSAPAGRKSKR